MKPPFYILPIIVIAQFFCTSLWFAGNAIMPDLIIALDLSSSDLGYMTSSVQLGFIVGTLMYALFTIPDRFHPSLVFFISSILAAGFNALITLESSFILVLVFRFFTGFFLAGIYPVGMKIASDYYEKGLGKALGFLVGALVLGTALPHLLTGLGWSLSWKEVLYATSTLAVTGGVLIQLFVPVGPFRKIGSKVKFKSAFKVFDNRPLRSAAFGYFGHMWELYAFWAFIPVMLTYYQSQTNAIVDVSLASFAIVAAGAFSCIIGGLLSFKYGENKVATIALMVSGICSAFSPFMFDLPFSFFLVYLLIWGLAVIPDSPLFSSLVASSAVPELKGTALTVVTCIGFSITIVSIQLLSYLVEVYPTKAYLVLTLGPIIGVISALRSTSESS